MAGPGAIRKDAELGARDLGIGDVAKRTDEKAEDHEQGFQWDTSVNSF